MTMRNPLELWYDDKNTIYDISECGMAGINILDQTFLIECVDYSNSRGELVLINQLCKQYNCRESNVLITNGASEAIFILIKMIIDEKRNNRNRVIYQTPYFSPLENYIADDTIEVSRYELREDCNYEFIYDDLQKLIDNDVLALLVNYPNNPTGCSLSADEYEKLFDLATDKGIYLIFDETTALVKKGTHVESKICNHLSNCICVNSVSKSFGLPGLRIGWIIASDAVIEKCQAIKEIISTCSASIMQNIAAKVLERRNYYFSSHRDIVDLNVQYFLKKAKQEEIDLMSTKISSEGMCCFIQLPDGINSKEFSQKLYEDYNVLVAPGECFNIEHHIRVGFGVPENIFTYSIDSLFSLWKKFLQDDIQ